MSYSNDHFKSIRGGSFIRAKALFYQRQPHVKGSEQVVMELLTPLNLHISRFASDIENCDEFRRFCYSLSRLADVTEVKSFSTQEWYIEKEKDQAHEEAIWRAGDILPYRVPPRVDGKEVLNPPDEEEGDAHPPSILIFKVGKGKLPVRGFRVGRSGAASNVAKSQPSVRPESLHGITPTPASTSSTFKGVKRGRPGQDAPDTNNDEFTEKALGSKRRRVVGFRRDLNRIEFEAKRLEYDAKMLEYELKCLEYERTRIQYEIIIGDQYKRSEVVMPTDESEASTSRRIDNTPEVPYHDTSPACNRTSPHNAPQPLAPAEAPAPASSTQAH